MFEQVHDQNGHQQAEEVGQIGGVEVDTWLAFQAIVEAQQQCDENAGNNDVAQTQHSEVGCLEAIGQQILWENQFDRSIEALGNSDHNVGTKHPEHIVNEEAGQQYQTGDNVVQVQQFNAVNGKCHAEQIVGDPVLGVQIPNANDRWDDQTHDIVHCEIVVDEIFLLVALAFGETDVEWRIWNAAGYQRTDDWTHQMGQRQHFQEEEVCGQKQIDVILREQLEYDVQAEEGHGGDEWEHHCIFWIHSFQFFAGFLQTNIDGYIDIFDYLVCVCVVCIKLFENIHNMCDFRTYCVHMKLECMSNSIRLWDGAISDYSIRWLYYHGETDKWSDESRIVITADVEAHEIRLKWKQILPSALSGV